MTRVSTTLEPLDVGEKDVISFDFASKLVGETILAASTEVVLMYGTDSNPSNFKIGSPQIDGQVINQAVGNAVLGSCYVLRCKAITASREIILSGTITGVKPQC